MDTLIYISFEKVDLKYLRNSHFYSYSSFENFLILFLINIIFFALYHVQKSPMIHD